MMALLQHYFPDSSNITNFYLTGTLNGLAGGNMRSWVQQMRMLNLVRDAGDWLVDTSGCGL